jgi:hypothetical protein
MVGRVRALFSLFAVVVCALSACGGDDSGSGEYREEASALCAEAKREAQRASPARNRQEWEAFLRDTLEFSRDYNRRYEALEPPEELAEEHARSMRLSLRAEDLTEDQLDDLEAGEALKDVLPAFLTEILEMTRRSNELARAMGLPDCVVPLRGPGGDAPAPA